MRDETFIRYFKEVYPNTYLSLVEDFEKAIRRKAAYTRGKNNDN